MPHPPPTSSAGPSSLAPPLPASSTSTHRHHHSNMPHPQHFQPTPTVESLDSEGIVQMDPETSERVLDRLARSAPADAASDSDDDQPGPDFDDDDGLDRTSSADWQKLRQGSIARKKWWRRPSPHWLLCISFGHALSMGMVIAPKTDMFNQLACLTHYPTTSSDNDVVRVRPPGSPTPSFPAMPRPNPAQPDDQEAQDFVSSYVGARSFGLDMSVEGSNASTTMPVFVEIGGVVLDKIKCRKSPEVQKAAAQFQTAMTITQGVLSALTTGWWGRLSDKWGRTRVMAIAMCGIITSDIVFLLTAKFPLVVPGGYRFLIVGPLVDGFLGGMPTMGATNNAYIADSTPDGTRAQIYSRFGGLMMLGFSVGPILGTAFIKKTNDILSVFYFSTVLHTCMFLIVLFVLPESLSSEARSLLARVHDRTKADAFARDEAERAWERGDGEQEAEADADVSGWSRLSGVSQAVAGRKSRGQAKRVMRRALGFLEPLEIFLPKWNEETGRMNWNLTFLAIGYSGIMAMMGVFAIKFQYMQFTFGWGAEQLGPYLTVLGGLRGVQLLVILPIIVRLLKPKTPKVKPPRDRSTDDLASAPDSDHAPSAANKRTKTLSDSLFDLKIVQVSLLIDIIGYVGIIFSQTAGQFMLATCLTPFGAGAGPAINSMALALLPSTKIAGRLFGGMAVLQACVSSVAGPLLFGLTYSYTTKTFPKAVFIVAFALLVSSLVAFSMIRLARPPSTTEEQRADDETEPLRGRDRQVKKVNGGGSSGYTFRSDDQPGTSSSGSH